MKKQPAPFADTLAKNMASVGYTDETLSAVIDYPPDTIYRWRTGRLNAGTRARKAVLQAITAKRTQTKSKP